MATFTFTTTVTAAGLAQVMGRPAGDTAVADAHAEAVALLTDATAEAFRPIPPPVCDDLVVRVARSCHENRTRHAHGAAAAQMGGETLVRSPRDPLAPAVGILARYVVPL